MSTGYSAYIKGLGPDGYWRLNEALGVHTYVDSSIGGTNPMKANTIWGVYASNQQAPAVQHDPSAAAVAFADETSLLVDSASAFGYAGSAMSAMFWINLSSNFSGFPRIFCKSGSGSSAGWGFLGSDASTGIYLYIGSTSFAAYGALPSANTWHQVVGTTDGAATQSIYIDGALVASAPATTIPSTTTHCSIAADDSGFPTDRLINATMAECAVFPRALTATEILNSYTIALASGGKLLAARRKAVA